MSDIRSDQILDQEEAAQGRDLFPAPGEPQLLEQAGEQAEASGWISDDNVSWPSAETHRGVAERRQDLYEVMQSLEAAVARPSGLSDWRLTIEDVLGALAEEIAAHTAEVEAPDGLFAEIADRAPHLQAGIENLRQEHRDLETACRRALSMTADWSVGELRRRVNVLLARLAMHRQGGAELLYDAFNVDIAAGD
ncbi:MAG TPA: hypothetical protein VMM14_06525 [Acidimicrobiia bacterium]|nr:hypothetical protein [Acidimicrobiia bacterium]